MPLKFDEEKSKKFLKKLFSWVGWLIWIAAIIYLFSRYLVLKNNFLLFFSMGLLGIMLSEIYRKIKNRKY